LNAGATGDVFPHEEVKSVVIKMLAIPLCKAKTGTFYERIDGFGLTDARRLVEMLNVFYARSGRRW
jgi:hypothetical protein